LPKSCSLYNGTQTKLACEVNTLCAVNEEADSACEALYCPGFSKEECDQNAAKGCLWDVDECKPCHRLAEKSCGGSSYCQLNKKGNTSEAKCQVVCSGYSKDECQNTFHPACAWSEVSIPANEQNGTKMFPTPVDVSRGCNRVCANRIAGCEKYDEKDCNKKKNLKTDCPVLCNNCPAKCEIQDQTGCGEVAVCQWDKQQSMCRKDCSSISGETDEQKELLCGFHDECKWQNSACQAAPSYIGLSTSSLIEDSSSADDDKADDSSDESNGEDDNSNGSDEANSDEDDRETSTDDDSSQTEDNDSSDTEDNDEVSSHPSPTIHNRKKKRSHRTFETHRKKEKTSHHRKQVKDFDHKGRFFHHGHKAATSMASSDSDDSIDSDSNDASMVDSEEDSEEESKEDGSPEQAAEKDSNDNSHEDAGGDDNSPDLSSDVN